MIINQISSALKQPLPGVEAQLKMANIGRMIKPSKPEKVRLASVLILLYQDGATWQMPLIQRQDNNPNDKHNGQISLPGGKHEKSDKSLSFTALREAEEEIGVAAEKITLLGQLTQLYVPVSNFLIHPFVGFIGDIPTFQRQQSEVKAILKAPLSVLQDKANVKFTNLTIREGVYLKNVPYFDVGGYIVWGATAMILNELVEVLERCKISF